jgi:hypothetical protein
VLFKKAISKEEMSTSILISALVLLLAANFLMMYVTPFGMTNLEGFQVTAKDASGNNFLNYGFQATKDASGNNFQDMEEKKKEGYASYFGFQATKDASGNNFQDMEEEKKKEGYASYFGFQAMKDASGNNFQDMEEKKKEGFATYALANGGGAGDSYEAIGAFDGVRLKTGNSSSWRFTSPNEPLRGPEFKPGADSLFIFKNNQCKPECCGASFSCSGGCVCTTPQQRDYINQRGGNRTLPDDSV